MRAYVTRPLLICSVLLLSACTQTLPTAQHSPTSVIGAPAHTPLPESVSSALSAQLGYALLVSEESHWGQTVELDVAPVYYSATGRLCREMTVSKQVTGLKEEVIACQYGQHWGVQRNVTRVLGQQPSSFVSGQ